MVLGRKSQKDYRLAGQNKILRQVISKGKESLISSSSYNSGFSLLTKSFWKWIAIFKNKEQNAGTHFQQMRHKCENI